MEEITLAAVETYSIQLSMNMHHMYRKKFKVRARSAAVYYTAECIFFKT